MKHINQVATGLEVSPNELRQICQLLGLQILEDGISPPDEERLTELKTVAIKEQMSLQQAAQKIRKMQQEAQAQQTSNSTRFDLRSYVTQRLGSDPETAASDSFVGFTYRHLQTSVKMGQFLYQAGLEVMASVAFDMLKHGSDNPNFSVESNQALVGAEDAMNRIDDKFSQNFLQQVNWGQEEHPHLLTGATLTNPTTLPPGGTKSPSPTKKSEINMPRS